MTRRDRLEWLLTAINAVEDLVQSKLEARRREKGDGTEETELDEQLQICMEELRVASEELINLRDRLEIERQRYADLFDFAPEAYVETDASGAIREANRAAARLLQVPQEHLVGKPLALFITEAKRRRFRTNLASIVQKGPAAQLEWDSEVQTRAGNVVEVQIAAAPVRGEVASPGGARCMLRARNGGATAPGVQEDGEPAPDSR